MRFLFTLLLLLPLLSEAQFCRVYDIDYSEYPLMKAHFIAVEYKGNQYFDIRKEEVKIAKSDEYLEVVSVQNPEKKEPNKISVVFAIDISGSMSGSNIDLAKQAAISFVKLTPLELSEGAVSTFNGSSYMNLDFTKNNKTLIDAINRIRINGGTSYDQGLNKDLTGALQIAKKGRYNKCVIFLTDGLGSANQEEIIKEANDNGITVYTIILNMSMPPALRNISEQTGGAFFENISTEKEAIAVYSKILLYAQNTSYGTVTWKDTPCGNSDFLRFSIRNHSLTVPLIVPESRKIQLEIIPKNYYFKKDKTEKDIKIKAVNGDVLLKNISNSNKHLFNVKHELQLPYLLKKGEEAKLQLVYTAEDKGLVFSKIKIESEPCAHKSFYVAGGDYDVVSKSKLDSEIELLSPNGGEVFIAGTYANIEWKNLNKGDKVILEYTHNNGTNWTHLAYADEMFHSWKVPAILSNDYKVNVKHLIHNEAEMLNTITAHNEGVTSLAASTDGKYYVSTSSDMSAKIWDAQNFSLLHELNDHDDKVKGVLVSSDSKLVITYSDDNTIKIWEAASGDLLHTLEEHSETINHISLSADNSRLITGSNDATAKVWDVATGDLLLSLEQHEAPLMKTFFYWGNDMAVTLCEKGKLIFWNLSTATPTTIAEAKDIDISSDGKKIAIVLAEGKVLAINQKNGTLSYELKLENAKITSVKFSADGERLASVADNKNVSVWQAYSGKLQSKMMLKYTPADMSFSNDARFLITDNKDVWDANSGVMLCAINQHKGKINAAVFSSDNKKIITASDDKTMMVWSSKPRNYILQHDMSDRVFSVISPRPKIQDVAFSQVVIGGYQDLMVQNFVNNANAYQVQIEKIEFAGANPNDFSIVSGIPPFAVPANSRANIEFRFQPSALGLRSAQLNVITATDTLVAKISGISIPPKCEIKNRFINFGKLKPAEKKDTTVLVLKNISNAAFDIDRIELIGPDTLQFAHINKSAKYTVAAGDSLELSFEYTALRRGGASTVFNIYIPGYAYPETVELYAECIAPRDVLLTGNIIDATTNKVIEGKVACFDLYSGRKIDEATTTIDKKYQFKLGIDRNYSIVAEVAGYFTASENVDLTSFITEEIINKDIKMMRLLKGANMRLNNIFFEFAKANLLDESTLDLNNLYVMLLNNSTVSIEISGHTDNIGNDGNNLKLSQDRANAVKKYLIDKGIDPARLTAKGYGESKPIANNDTEEGRQLNRRVEIKLLKI